MKITDTEPRVTRVLPAKACVKGELYWYKASVLFLRCKYGMVSLETGAYYADDGPDLLEFGFVKVPPGHKFTIENAS